MTTYFFKVDNIYLIVYGITTSVNHQSPLLSKLRQWLKPKTIHTSINCLSLN